MSRGTLRLTLPGTCIELGEHPAPLSGSCPDGPGPADGGAYPTVTATEGYPVAPLGSGCSWAAVWV